MVDSFQKLKCSWILTSNTSLKVLKSEEQGERFYQYIKKGVSLHSQPKVRFREYFLYFLMRPSFKKLNIQRVQRTLILHINNC